MYIQYLLEILKNSEVQMQVCTPKTRECNTRMLDSEKDWGLGESQLLCGGISYQSTPKKVCIYSLMHISGSWVLPQLGLNSSEWGGGAGVLPFYQTQTVLLVIYFYGAVFRLSEGHLASLAHNNHSKTLRISLGFSQSFFL